MKNESDYNDGENHVFQLTPPTIYEATEDLQVVMVNAIVSLLKEVQVLDEKRSVEMGDGLVKGGIDEGNGRNGIEDYRNPGVLSRYGVWLLVGLVPPLDKPLPFEMIGQLFSALFHWYDMTAYLKDDVIGNALNNLKPMYLREWVIGMGDLHSDILASTLLPHPLPSFTLSTIYEGRPSAITILKDGLNRLLSLLPYNLISPDVWTYVMCYWMEAIRKEVEWKNLTEFKVLLRKLFDNSLGVSGLSDAEKLYFVAVRLTSLSCSLQHQTLLWMQILTSVGVFMDMCFLIDSLIKSTEILNISYNIDVDSIEDIKKENNRNADYKELECKNIDYDFGGKVKNNLNMNRNKNFDGAYDKTANNSNKESKQEKHGSEDGMKKMKSLEEECVILKKITIAYNDVTQCFILMQDVLLKQLEIKEEASNQGIHSPASQRILSFIYSTNNFILSAYPQHVFSDKNQTKKPSHQSKSTTSSCTNKSNLIDQLDCRYFKLNLQLLQFIVPSQPQSLPLFEFNTPKQPAFLFDEENVKIEILMQSLPPEFHFSYSLIQFILMTTDPSTHLILLQTIFHLTQHTNFLHILGNDQEKLFMHYLLKKLLIPCFWDLLSTKYNQLNSVVISLIIYCLTLPSGNEIFDDIVENDFTNKSFSVRFSAVEKICILASWLNQDKISSNHLVQSSLAHAFVHLVSTSDDTSSTLVIQASLMINSLSYEALKCIRSCLERHFDLVVRDRNLILTILTKLSSILSANNKRPCILTWSFFLERLDVLCLEGQIVLQTSGEITHLQDIHHSDLLSKYFLGKVSRARMAIKLNEALNKEVNKKDCNQGENIIDNIAYKLFEKCSFVRFRNNQPVQNFSKEVYDKLYNNHACKIPQKNKKPSIPTFRNRGSKFGSSLFANFPVCGHLREFTDGENDFSNMVQKTLETDVMDLSTLHHLVSLLLKFMVDPGVQEDISEKSQISLIEHVSTLMGYSINDRVFSIPPYKLRSSVVFNAFISGLAKVTDLNFCLGNLLLPFSLELLQYSPSPQRYASDFQPPNYSLWYLEPHIRICWLQTLLIILYKYSYSKLEVITRLIKVTINTIASRSHQCRAKEVNHAPPSPYLQRNRDTSNVSVRDLENILEDDETIKNSSDEDDDYEKIEEENEKGDGSSESHENKWRAFKLQDGNLSNSTDFSLKFSKNIKCLNRTNQCTSDILNRLNASGPTTFISQYTKKIGKNSGDDSENIDGENCFVRGFSCCMNGSCSGGSGLEKGKRLAEYRKGLHSNEGFSTLALKVPSMKCKSGTNIVEENKFKIQNGVLFEEDEEEEDNEDGADNEDIYSNDYEDKYDIQSARKVSSVNKSNKEIPSINIDNSSNNTQDMLNSKDDFDNSKNNHNNFDATNTSNINENKSCYITSSINFRMQKTRKSGLRMVQMVKELDNGGCTSGNCYDGSIKHIEKDNSLYSERKNETKLLEPHWSKEDTNEKMRTNFNKNTTKNNNNICNNTSNNSNNNSAMVVDTCPKCSAVLENFDEEVINTSIVCLATFVHREPVMASPLLPSMLLCVSRVVNTTPYLWQSEQSNTKMILSGDSCSTARQFIRCVLHQLAPNNIFPQLFIAVHWERSFIEVIVSALMDFPELNFIKALQITLEGINKIHSITNNQLNNTICNLATYLDFIPSESIQSSWSTILTHFDIFFRKVSLILAPPIPPVNFLLKIIISLLKLPNFTQRPILEPFSKVVSFAIQFCSFDLQLLIDVCSLCGRAFTKERDKLYLSRCVVFELVAAIKFKQFLPDDNFLLLVQLVCLDAGGTIGPVSIVKELATYSFNPHSQSLVSTNIADLFKQHLPECIEFIADIHTSNKLKSNLKGVIHNLNEDTIGSHLKVAISQYVALEFSHSFSKESKMLGRHFPWLLHPPSSIQQGSPREFVDCICHIRVLCWLLLGSLMHSAVTKAAGAVICRPLPLNCCSFVADQVMVILTGFSAQAKTSVLHMSSLFYAFVLCQLWTVYCELQEILNMPNNEETEYPHPTIMHFWNKVTPGILHLLSHSKVMSEMVNLHLLSLIEALQECHSTVLVKLFSLWVPILRSYHSQLPGHMQVRLQKCENWKPTVSSTGPQVLCEVLLKWVRRVQFKLSQIEVQSSTAAQFYTV